MSELTGGWSVTAILDLETIEPNPNNPRKSFDPEALEQLAQSIREVGLLQPLVVERLEKNERYRIICGERRWRAAKLAGLKRVPAMVETTLTPAQIAEIMLIENLQRKDLDPIEEARAYQALLKEHDYTQEALAEKLGVSQGHIANRLRLLELPDSVKENISRGIISPSHGRVLAGFKNLPERVLKRATETITEEQVPVSKAVETVMRVIAEEGKPLFNDYDGKLEFKTDQCEKCGFRVMGNRWGYGNESPYCIKPSCWEKKQQEIRRERELALADRVQKAAKKGQGILELDKFSYDQYEEFRGYKIKDMDLSECENCEHKKTTKRSYSDELTEACFQPSCFKKKQAAATREKNKIKRTELQEECAEAEKLAGSWVEGVYCEAHGFGMAVIERPALLYLAGHIIGGISPIFDRNVTLYRWCRELFGWGDAAEVLKRGTFGMLTENWDAILKLLDTLEDRQLLQIIFEWPAVAMGMKGAAGWFLRQAPAKETPVEPESEAKKYIDAQGRVLFVSAGLGDEYGTFWRSASGGLHRVKSPAMPMVASREEAQRNLDAWAEKKGLKPVEPAGEGEGAA